MKKISSIFYFLFLLFSFLNLSSSKVNAQTYYFMNDSATWKIDWFGYDIDCMGYCYEWEYYISGDTIINSHSFKKLREKYHNIYTQDYSEGNAGAIREDTVNKKVYYVAPSYDTTQKLLYDFDLNIGDTLPIPGTCQYGPCPVVDSIDYIMIGNENHKRFWIINTSSIEATYLIEGVGSNFGLLESIVGYSEAANFLTCFKVGNEVLFNAIDTMYYGCDINIPLSIENAHNTSPIQIFNDADNDLLIIQNSTQQNLSIKLFDELGREYLHQSSSSTKFQFSTSPLAAGIYFVECADEKGINLLSQKIFVK